MLRSPEGLGLAACHHLAGSGASGSGWPPSAGALAPQQRVWNDESKRPRSEC